MQHFSRLPDFRMGPSLPDPRMGPLLGPRGPFDGSDGDGWSRTGGGSSFPDKKEEKPARKKRESGARPYPGSPPSSPGNGDDGSRDNKGRRRHITILPHGMVVTTEDADMSVEQIKKDYTVVQHPTTIIPLGLSAVALLVSIAGGGLPAFAFAGGAGLFGLGSAMWRLAKRGKHIDEKTQQLHIAQSERRKREEERKLVELRGSILRGFTEIGSKEGLKELGELVKEYEELKQFFDSISQGVQNTRTLSVKELYQSAERLYRLGLTALSNNFTIMRAVTTVNRSNLERDAERLSQEIEILEKKESSASLLEIKRKALELHRERLADFDQKQIEAEDMLHKSDRCEAALQKMRLEIPALMNAGSEDELERVLLKIQISIKVAQEVEQELKKRRPA